MTGRIAEGWLDAIAATQTLTPRQKTVGAVLHGAIVEQLERGGQITPAELGRRAGLERRAAKRALEALVKQGWAEHDADEFWLVIRADPPPPPGQTGACPACAGEGWVEVAPPPGQLVGSEAEQPWLSKCARCNGSGRRPAGELELEPDPPAIDPDPGSGDDLPF